jgi:hypothetical protein
MLGELRVDHGVPKCEPSYECVAELKQKQDERPSESRDKPEGSGDALAAMDAGPKQTRQQVKPEKEGFLRGLARSPDRPILQREREREREYILSILL